MKKFSINFFGPIIIFFLKLYWFIFRPKTRGVNCIIQFENKILFVRHSYGSKKWTLPGGGVKRKETFEDAVKREAREEVDIILNNIKKVGVYVSNKEYKIDTVQCFLSEVDSSHFKIDNFEILEAKWAGINEIPVPHGPRLVKILEYVKNKKGF
jgi:ADP-ribose pyrophosphatase YjhB (NUDIX family)